MLGILFSGVLVMVSLGYGYNDNRLRVWGRLMEEMLYRFDYMRLCQRQITAMHHFFDFDL